MIVGKTKSMAIAKVNTLGGGTRGGGRYNWVHNAWLLETGFGEISAAERYRAVKIAENLPAILEWRASLPPEETRRQNHPTSIWLPFCRTLKPSSPRRGRGPKALFDQTMRQVSRLMVMGVAGLADTTREPEDIARKGRFLLALAARSRPRRCGLLNLPRRHDAASLSQLTHHQSTEPEISISR